MAGSNTAPERKGTAALASWVLQCRVRFLRLSAGPLGSSDDRGQDPPRVVFWAGQSSRSALRDFYSLARPTRGRRRICQPPPMVTARNSRVRTRPSFFGAIAETTESDESMTSPSTRGLASDGQLKVRPTTLLRFLRGARGSCRPQNPGTHRSTFNITNK